MIFCIVDRLFSGMLIEGYWVLNVLCICATIKEHWISHDSINNVVFLRVVIYRTGNPTAHRHNNLRSVERISSNFSILFQDNTPKHSCLMFS